MFRIEAYTPLPLAPSAKGFQMDECRHDAGTMNADEGENDGL